MRGAAYVGNELWRRREDNRSGDLDGVDDAPARGLGGALGLQGGAARHHAGAHERHGGMDRESRHAGRGGCQLVVYVCNFGGDVDRVIFGGR